MKNKILAAIAVLTLAGCATVTPPAVVAEAPAAPRNVQIQAAQAVPQSPIPTLKRKIAIGRFSNETRYGRTFQTDANLDPLGKQTADILTSRLVDSKRFLVFERPDMNKVIAEQRLNAQSGLVGVDTLIIGSLTEFGRSTTGKSGFLSATKVQTAKAKVEVRLVDVRTGYAFFSTSGSGEANTESGQIAGYGSAADYDGTLNDQAIAAAISDMIGRLITKLEERAWRTDILKVAGKQVYIAGGQRQGIKVGDDLVVYQAGEEVKSSQSGMSISLPPTAVATLRVSGLFGESDINEGAVCELVSGTLPSNTSGTYVAQGR